MLLLSKNDIKKVFSIKDAIEADKYAFRIFSEGKSVVPLRVNVSSPNYEGQTLFMPGQVSDLDSIGVKIVSVFPNNITKGKKSVSATMILIDGTNGEVCCILDGTYITQLRTGAASGAATDVLARPDASIAAIIGTGGQASTQLESILAVRKIKEVRVFDANWERTSLFANEMQKELACYGAAICPVETAEAAIKDADIITTVTTSSHPVFDGRRIKQGAHINAVGSYMPHMQELDEYIVQHADKIFCDSVDAVIAESGDFIIPINKGLITAEKITGEIGQVIANSVRGRERADEITLFKTVGIAVQDVVTAYQVYQKAKAQQIGQDYAFAD